MVDADVIAAKLADLADRIDRVRTHRPTDAEILGEDRDVLDLESFNLMLAVQACTDVASHLIADEGWPPATDLAEAFRRLHEHGVISRQTSEALARVGLAPLLGSQYREASPIAAQ